jgi:hypothetical protein
VPALVSQAAVQRVPNRQLAQELVAIGQPQVGLRDPVPAAQHARPGIGAEQVQIAPELVRACQHRWLEAEVASLLAVLPDGLDEGGVHTPGRLG